MSVTASAFSTTTYESIGVPGCESFVCIYWLSFVFVYRDLLWYYEVEKL